MPSAQAAEELGVLKLHADMLQAKLAEVEAFKRAVQNQLAAAEAQATGAKNNVADTAEIRVAHAASAAGSKSVAAQGSTAAAMQKASQLPSSGHVALHTGREAHGRPRCCDDACVTVAVDCSAVPSTAASTGNGDGVPNKSTLMSWLESGTPQQRKEAANLLYEERHGAVIKSNAHAHASGEEKPKLIKGILRLGV